MLVVPSLFLVFFILYCFRCCHWCYTNLISTFHGGNCISSQAGLFFTLVVLWIEGLMVREKKIFAGYLLFTLVVMWWEGLMRVKNYYLLDINEYISNSVHITSLLFCFGLHSCLLVVDFCYTFLSWMSLHYSVFYSKLLFSQSFICYMSVLPC